MSHNDPHRGSRAVAPSSPAATASSRLAHLALALVLGGLAAIPAVYAQTRPLNDTGQTQCYDTSNIEVSCDEASAGDGAARPRQDGRFGRDAQAAAGTLSKTGSGAAGFDFTRICMSGEAAGEGSCPADPPQGSGANEWACTRDNVTGLVWSIETLSGTWTAATTTLPATYNSASRCGFNTGWRLPTRHELPSLIHHGKTSSPMIDLDNFPGTLPLWYWTNDTYAPNSVRAWMVEFETGKVLTDPKTYTHRIRLVLGAQ